VRGSSGVLGQPGFGRIRVLDFWDSNGGSLSRGVIMGMRNQQWPWFAILARTGRGRNATLLLENAGYERYLPVSKFIRRWSDRLKEEDVPLFRWYLFCRMKPHSRLPVSISPGVIATVGLGQTPITAAAHDIAAH